MNPIHLFAVVLLLGALLAGGPLAVAEEPSSEVKPAGPTTLAELERALTAEADRLEKLLEMCRKDKRFREVDTYRRYTIQDFSNSKRPVKALDLLDIVADPDAPLDLRKDAKEVLESKQASSFDPDLQRTKGNAKPRNEFFRRHVTKLLTNTKSEHTRRFAHQLLLSYFPGHKNDNEVLTYDAKNGTRTQWKRTASYWSKVLRR